MTRNRASAKKAGTEFETLVASGLASFLRDDRIERRTKNGNKDRGDIGGVRVHGQRLVVECKNTASVDLAGWAGEVEAERGNDDALAGVIVHKRARKAQFLDQWVSMTMRNFLAILTGYREPE